MKKNSRGKSLTILLQSPNRPGWLTAKLLVNIGYIGILINECCLLVKFLSKTIYAKTN